jgi:YesN/AraC family two-component response regulator
MKSILIVEDEAQMRTMLSKVLARGGYKVVEAKNGDEGMRLFRAQPADLVITDLIMPGKKGLELIAELKREFPQTKMIAISGGGWRVDDEEYLSAAEKLGVDYSLSKPFQNETLLSMVNDLLKR